jgi:hypothetical protein
MAPSWSRAAGPPPQAVLRPRSADPEAPLAGAWGLSESHLEPPEVEISRYIYLVATRYHDIPPHLIHRKYQWRIPGRHQGVSEPGRGSFRAAPAVCPIRSGRLRHPRVGHARPERRVREGGGRVVVDGASRAAAASGFKMFADARPGWTHIRVPERSGSSGETASESPSRSRIRVPGA